jgi:beta-galactosidase GanA
VGAGGPIIAMQVENEYGSYGNDHLYLRHLELQFRQHQIDAILFASNGYSPVICHLNQRHLNSSERHLNFVC